MNCSRLRFIGIVVVACHGIVIDPDSASRCQEKIFEAHGESSCNELGHSVAAAGDLNADGFDDVIIAVPHPCTSGTGYAVVLSGRDGAELYRFYGEWKANFAAVVGRNGDANADGILDLLVGSPGNGGVKGTAKVYSGKDGSQLHRLEGGSPGDGFGASVAFVGDANGDGREDFLVGALDRDSNDFNSGSAYLYSGADRAVLQAFHGTQYQERLGQRVNSAGDLDQDGAADCIVVTNLNVLLYSGANGALLREIPQPCYAADGAGDLDGDGFPEITLGFPFENNNAGRVDVLSGRDGTVLYTWTGEGSLHLFGWSVADGGDLNVDGIPDVLIGAPLLDHDGYTPQEGGVYAYSGATGRFLCRWRGTQDYAWFGRSVDGAGDLNGDAVPDVLAGASQHDNGVGAAFAFSGNDLFLYARDPWVIAERVLTLLVRGGRASAPVALFLVAIDGAPVNYLLGIDQLNRFGNWSFSQTVPSELAGRTLEFLAFACSDAQANRGTAESSPLTIEVRRR